MRYSGSGSGVSLPWSARDNFSLSLWTIWLFLPFFILVTAVEITSSTLKGPLYLLSNLFFFTSFMSKTKSLRLRLSGN